LIFSIPENDAFPDALAIITDPNQDCVPMIQLGYGSPSRLECLIIDNDQDGFANSIDCDDENPNVNPGQFEVPYNGLDDDCNPITLDDDLDQDGFAIVDDCDDTNNMINPSQLETIYNGLDDDCNPATLDDDLDQDGFINIDDCDDLNASINPDAIEIPNNGIDEDCDGTDLISAVHSQEFSGIKIYPNPTSDLLYIELEKSSDFIIFIYNTQGILLTESTNISTLDFRSFQNGIYVLKIKDLKSGNQFVGKIIKVE